MGKLGVIMSYVGIVVGSIIVIILMIWGSSYYTK